MKTRRKMALMLVALLVLSTGSVIAQTDSAIQLDAVAEIEVEVVDDQGEKKIQRQEASLVVPGDEVIYTINFANVGQEPVDDVVITNPVPEHMLFRLMDGNGSGMRITMSVDGGQQYGAPETLTVTDADGSERPAKPQDYTHIRWAFDRPVEPGDKGSVGFRALLL